MRSRNTPMAYLRRKKKASHSKRTADGGRLAACEQLGRSGRSLLRWIRRFNQRCAATSRAGSRVSILVVLDLAPQRPITVGGPIAPDGLQSLLLLDSGRQQFQGQTL